MIFKKNNFTRAILYLKNNGFRMFLAKILERFNLIDPYKLWIKKFEPDKNTLKKQKSFKFSYSPKISIVVSTFNTQKNTLLNVLNSVTSQTYSNWQLCIADRPNREIIKLLKTYLSKDKRITVKFFKENPGIVYNLNRALKLADGDYIAFLDQFDTLAPFALYEIVKAINQNPDADFIYPDEDKISKNGRKRFEPHFKPDFSPDLLRSYNYIGNLIVVKKQLIDKVGIFREGYEVFHDYDFILRCVEKAKKIIHIPKVLYHKRFVNKFLDENKKLYAHENGKNALSDHLSRVGLKGKVENLGFLGFYKINYEISNYQKISIIIPNKDHKDDLKKCIESILKSTYNNYEIIIAENNTTDKSTLEYYEYLQKTYDFIKIIRWSKSKEFNYSEINNFAVSYASGDILLFLNNDIEIINNNWMEEMLMFIQRDDVGAVGAKLLYPDNTIQHAGVIIGLGGAADHSHRYFPAQSNGYFMRLKVVQNISAVTGACLMTKKSVFNEVGGFDERYQIAFNDIDFCLKIRQMGYLIVFTPFAKAYHFEFKTRGRDDTFEKQQKFKKEKDLFTKNWRKILDSKDPYYNVNLTLQRFDFSVNI
ncbi:Glycosyltransferase, GT2 family [Desulfurella multipotens]|uniref:Glycosyltransferase, GT2 family n=1 Tax=Desulfurella multipotens TaxID=79269 RepID=A0A1G6QUT0_9BACT|nr:glycosyltransferase family 2 protein [Desulfurella multipotens]SDC96128.1 Glycosyltransferase, GT2 family [Desulfurella multipotens]